MRVQTPGSDNKLNYHVVDWLDKNIFDEMQIKVPVIFVHPNDLSSM